MLGFSNSNWNTPLQKVEHGKALFKEIVQNSPTKEELVSNLINLLKDSTKFDDDQELKRRIGHYPDYTQYSSIYVDVPAIKYGSRTKTVILIDKDNHMDFFEESVQEDGTWAKTHIQRHLIQ